MTATRLHATCPHCRESARLGETVRTRLDLQRAHRDAVPVDCLGCCRTFDVHPDDVRASNSHAVAIGAVVALVVAVALTVWLWGRGCVSTVPPIAAVALFGAWSADARRKADAFNAYRVGRR